VPVVAKARIKRGSAKRRSDASPIPLTFCRYEVANASAADNLSAVQLAWLAGRCPAGEVSPLTRKNQAISIYGVPETFFIDREGRIAPSTWAP
jgi:hypothetical protein